MNDGEDLRKLRVAIVHYWFVSRGGGERVVEALAELFPQADLFALVADRAAVPETLRTRRLQTSFLQHLPGAVRFHRHFLPLQPLALEQFDLSDYDLVLSSEAGPAKGVITAARTCHICYCHSPMRYIWEMQHDYLRGMGALVGGVFRLTAHSLRLWDLASAARVDYFVANSQFIAARIRKYYRRASTVIYPPVEIDAAYVHDPPGAYYLAVGRLVEYKRFDLAIDACTRLKRPLRVVGVGPQGRALRGRAGSTVEFLGSLSDAELWRQFAGCRALLFPGEEDFGLVPVEAESFGRPVIAYGAGGVLETVRAAAPGLSRRAATGVFFYEQSVDALQQAILDFEAHEREFQPSVMRAQARRFSKTRFQREMMEFVQAALRDFRRSQPASEFARIA